MTRSNAFREGLKFALGFGLVASAGILISFGLMFLAQWLAAVIGGSIGYIVAMGSAIVGVSIVAGIIVYNAERKYG
jgi:hypothetical protein